MHNFRELKVWNKAIEIVEGIYLLAKKLPESEKFAFTSQITRCSISIPSNIAEGAGRGTNKDFIRFLNMATGSCYELETQLILINKIFRIEVEEMISKTHEVEKMIFALRKSLK